MIQSIILSKFINELLVGHHWRPRLIAIRFLDRQRPTWFRLLTSQQLVLPTDWEERRHVRATFLLAAELQPQNNHYIIVMSNKIHYSVSCLWQLPCALPKARDQVNSCLWQSWLLSMGLKAKANQWRSDPTLMQSLFKCQPLNRSRKSWSPRRVKPLLKLYELLMTGTCPRAAPTYPSTSPCSICRKPLLHTHPVSIHKVLHEVKALSATISHVKTCLSLGNRAGWSSRTSGQNARWAIIIKPDSNFAVTTTLQPTRRICRSILRRFK